ncbi:adhesin biosynthesis transcription regulatory family protein [Arsukibacterium indicum]|uniref:Adhesin biosynthesis transcription regulatory family protein n=1 Tax=Arsukibacterium indicum TaxID=2848612 RepID=A0ABS6MGL4_9GAMM|nr:adhesin biosynthesis transcription regulatory family protein [Arsukibacterium indicum]MBV2127966.1 adhesin biosynthesis transcription regulatory family protein [Arsukibacterium indicum]
MKYLLQGGESRQRLALLFSLTKITSNNVQDALTDHLCTGLSDTVAAAMNGVQLSNFTRALKTLNEVAGIVEKIKEHDWARLKSVK